MAGALSESSEGSSIGKSGLLTVDVLTAAYLASTAIIALISRTETGLWLALLHLLGIGLVFGLGRLPRPAGTLGAVLRIAYPVAVTPLFYMELATLNQLLFPGYFDPAVQAWEEAVFGVQLSVKASEWIPYRWFSEILHLGYVSYYLVVPTALIAAWRAAGREGLERAAFTTALAFFLCYLCFAVFPVAGPRYDFAKITGPPSDGYVFGIVHTILESGSSKGTAFPSSHVGATVSAWLSGGAVNPRAFWILAPFAVSLTLGTVYGRFHYGIDMAAGLAFALTAFFAAPPLIRRLGRRP